MAKNITESELRLVASCWGEQDWLPPASALDQIQNRLWQELLKLGLSEGVRVSINKTVREDLILPILDLGPNPEITAGVYEDEVSVSIGPRDWQWDKAIGEMIGCGTFIG